MKPELLVPEVGSLYGHLFENEATGVPLGVYWNLYVPFKRIRIGDSDFGPAILVDWLTWPVKSWRKIDGLKLDDVKAPDFIEPSFYTVEHFEMKLKGLRFGPLSENLLDVYVNAFVEEMEGPEGQVWRETPIKVEAKAKVDGIYVVPGNLSIAKEEKEKLSQILGRFVELEEFLPPVWENNFRYTYAPRI